MSQLIVTDTRRALIGMGVTGLSVARFWQKQGQSFSWFDSRETPPQLSNIKQEFEGTDFHCGSIDADALTDFSEIAVSPGIDLRESWLQPAIKAGIDIIGDIELFARATSAPVVAITGSNAKSTVTTLLGDMATKSGLKVAVGGNLGTAALDLLDDSVELYVLELSSFQLETLNSLKPKAATILNVSADHMDRYDSMQSYHGAKQRIYRGAQKLVSNRDDLLSQPLLSTQQSMISFGISEPTAISENDPDLYGLEQDVSNVWLRRGRERILNGNQLKVMGQHNLLNVLAALALGEACGLEQDAMLTAATDFSGLPHRTEWVASKSGVTFINDSKATNIAATEAAIRGLSTGKNILLIAGGQAKGQHFNALYESCHESVKQLVLLGEDAKQMAVELENSAPTVLVSSMQDAVSFAEKIADEGDVVLLSPACSSFDMFSGYEDRGEQYRVAVEVCV